MKEILELIIAFLVIISVLVGFLHITLTTSSTQLYNPPTSMVQALAYDTEELLIGIDLSDLYNPSLFNELNELYPELHFRVRVSPLYMVNINCLSNLGGQYLDFSSSSDKSVYVCPPEPAEVTVVAIKTGQNVAMISINGSNELKNCDFIGIEDPAPAVSELSLAIAIMKTEAATYVAYKVDKKSYIEAIFTFREDGLYVMIPNTASDGHSVSLKNNVALRNHSAYMILMNITGGVENRTINLEFTREEDKYYVFRAYDENGNRITQVNDGTILAIVPKYPQDIVKQYYNIIALPFINPEGGFTITYGSTPPEDFPISTYEYITYIDGVPVLVTVDVWRASS